MAIRFAMAVGSPMDENVDKSPDGRIPSSSNKTLVGNLNIININVNKNTHHDSNSNNNMERKQNNNVRLYLVKLT